MQKGSPTLRLRRWFCIYGVPEELSSDGGPPFSSDDYETTDNWGFKHVAYRLRIFHRATAELKRPLKKLNG